MAVKSGLLYPLKPSFAGGELTPALYGRSDLQKYDVGAATLENAIVLRYGGVSRRPGLRYVAGTANNKKARLIPFQYNTEQSYVLEFTAGCIRFFCNGGILMSGGSPVTVATSYTEAELPTIKYTQSADVLFLVQPNHPPATLTRYSATDWRLEQMNISLGPFEDSNTNDSLKISTSGTAGTVTLAATASYFNSSMIGQTMRLGHTVPSQYVSGVPTTTTLQVSACPGASVYVESFGFWDGNFSVEKYDRGTGTWVKLQTQSGNRTQNYNMKYTNEDDEVASYRVTSTVFNIDVWEDENERQRGYVTIQSFAQDYYGVVKITGVSSGTSATGTVIKTLGATTATNDFSMQAWSSTKGYPYCVNFFEDRLVFAGSATKPQTYWASASGDYKNFWVNTPQEDDDAITGTLSGGQMNGIKAMVPFSEMLMFTAGGEYKVGGGSEAFTPTNQQAKPQEYRGINDLTPVVIGGRVVYVQHQGSIVRDLTYSYDVDKYTGDDISILAAHLFDGHTIVGMTYQQTPNSVVWCVRDDGVLLGMTYIKEQDVYAWHRHTTDGRFIDVCSSAGPDSDELWAVVERGGKYFVEQMGSQIRNTVPEDQFFVDAGYQYSGTATNTLTGLTWLASRSVQVLADGNEVKGLTVSAAGVLTLPYRASKIVVGLQYKTLVETLPLEFSARDGVYASRQKRIARMMVMMRDTRGGRFGLSEDRMDEIKWRSTEPYGEPMQLYEGKRYIVLPKSGYTDTLQVFICQDEPLPMTVLSIVPEEVPGG